MPVAGGGPRRIYWQGLDNTVTQWIDNETVLICTFDIWWDINTVNVNTREVSTLLSIYDAYVGSTYLSPDSKRLFVRGCTSEYGNPDVEYSFFRIYSTETWEYKEFIIGKNYINYFPNGPWSPDGTRIGIVITGPNTHLGYFDLAIDDCVMVFRSEKLILNPGTHVIWSPDSEHFLASEERDDNVLRVFAVDVE